MGNGVECKRPIAFRQKIREHLVAPTCPVTERQARIKRFDIRPCAVNEDCITDIDQAVRRNSLAVYGFSPNVHLSDLDDIERPSGHRSRACNYEPVGAWSFEVPERDSIFRVGIYD